MFEVHVFSVTGRKVLAKLGLSFASAEQAAAIFRQDGYVVEVQAAR